MNRDPFLRAALILILTGAAAVLYAFFGPWRAVAFGAVGIVFAVFVSIDYTPEPPPVERKAAPRERGRVGADGKPEGFELVG